MVSNLPKVTQHIDGGAGPRVGDPQGPQTLCPEPVLTCSCGTAFTVPLMFFCD